MKEIVKIKLNNIDSFENHPFKVNKDDSLNELITSIRENGLLNPLIVRRKENGRFEMISGHRRRYIEQYIIEAIQNYNKKS